MALSPGTLLGPYEILAPVGAGGMGEVYKARDTRLERTVAVKMCAEQFTERFDREARAVAALNHPNICTLHDVGPNYLVMEYIEGPTLAERIRGGPVPLDEALPIARQIAEALEAAHEKGIVHRDLKPANIKLTSENKVKVLDFGLAKAFDGDTRTPDAANSPTLTIGATRAGMILGTAAYMSPEQARGGAVDKRTDIWAFGVVLYEILTGRAMFAAETISDTLASVLKTELDWAALPAETPAAIRKLLRRCLERDRRKRLCDIGDARLEIDEALAEGPPQPAAPEAPVASRWPWMAATAAAVVLALALAGVVVFRKPPERATIRFQVQPPEGETLPVEVVPTISPDGGMLAFVVNMPGGRTQLRVRSLETGITRALPETEGAAYCFWSPDSRFLGFFADGKLKKIDITGGPPQVLCDVERRLATGAWSRADVILFRGAVDIRRVSASGGTPVPVVVPDPAIGESSADFPHFLPDGRRFLYAVFGRSELRGLYWQSIDSKNPNQRNRILAGAAGAVLAPGAGSAARLLFSRQTTLVAQAFDPATLRLSGDAVPVAQSIATFGPMPSVSASDNGVLAYRTGNPGQKTQLSWFSREGKHLGDIGAPQRLWYPALSPDDKHVVMSVSDSGDFTNFDLWVHDMSRGTLTRLTFNPDFDGYPVWSPDGARIVFGSSRAGKRSLFMKAASGAGTDEELFQTPNLKIPTDWSRDGRYLLFSENDPKKAKHDIWTLDMETHKATLFLKSGFNQMQGQFSPDGRWVAYVSDESKTFQVYVQSFPPSGGQWQVSVDGGLEPHWRRDGKELYFISPDRKMMAVPVKLGATFEAGIPKELFASRIANSTTGGTYGSYYAVSGDGQRFLINSHIAETRQEPIQVVVNWK